jgi:hypothetical protein
VLIEQERDQLVRWSRRAKSSQAPGAARPRAAVERVVTLGHNNVLDDVDEPFCGSPRALG